MVRVHLERGSSVRVSGRAAIGKVQLPTATVDQRQWLTGGTAEAVVGEGTGRLEVEASMGTVRVSAEG